jgi:uncharacterized protein YabE (DUF348 family)
MQIARIILFAGLVVALGVISYLYYDATKEDVSVKIDVPDVEIQRN